MSNASSDDAARARVSKIPSVPWKPWLGVLFIVFIYYASQLFSGILLSVYPGLRGWSQTQALDWLSESVGAQFTFILLAEVLSIGAIYLFLKRYKLGFASIGLKKPRWNDLFNGLLAVPVYFLLYVVTVGIVSHLVPGLDVDQEQQIGFNNVQGGLPLLLTFISLVVLPPLAEEIMVRGFLYSTLKKALPLIGAVILTSLLFASAHLPEGGAAGPLYIAALDTFVLSLVLIYLREKTGSL
ncbi:MAG TPA: CPBP family intramembrane glutamic endopeptidase, partial [Candidatus Saccharimonadales bacterium]|nr:CPBP family intramembrane glutamic endopeptidase [Candidatus Saccharimonadales bacterium]